MHFMKLDMNFGMGFEIDLKPEAGDLEHFIIYESVS